MLTDNYAFPVALREIQTIDGQPIPKSRAVVRTDTNEALSVVSNRYHIIENSQVVETVEPFMSELGKPTVLYNVVGNGRVFHAEYRFTDHVVDVGGRNRVALRIIVTNAYQAGWKLRLRVACLVLECLNCGIFGEKDIFELAVSHVGKTDIRGKVKPEDVLTAFTGGAAIYRHWAQVGLALESGTNFFNEHEEMVKALPDSTRTAIVERWQRGYETQRTVWDLLQHSTYEITHNSPRLGYTGRLQRLQKTARLFNKQFAGY